MPEQSAKEAAPRVVLLARAGKAADNLAGALREAGMTLVMVADPAGVDEAEIRSHSPQALLVALEPSIEHALDKLDELLADPSLTVIFDEADLAAHRAGWDAARWVRHLAAKLRRDTNVLPPGTESEQDWQPSPGQLPSLSAAYADMDTAIFTREAVARAESVPSDGMQPEPAPAMPALDPVLAASFAETIPSAPAVQPPPLPPLEPAIVEFRSESLEAAVFEEAAAPETVARDVALPGSISMGPVAIESVVAESTMTLDDPVDRGLVEPEPMRFDPVPGDGPLSLEPMSFETAATERMSIDSVQLDSMSIGNVSADAVASDIAPMAFDDDAFFLEELSATDASAFEKDVNAPMSFESGFDTDFGNDDAEGSAPSPDSMSPPREMENVLTFEELIADSMAAAEAGTMPAPVQWSGTGEEPSEARPSEPEPSQAKRSFSLEGLSLSPVDDAPAIVEKPQAAPAVRDLSALEARISGLSLVDDDDSAAAVSTGANGVVLIEAGLGGPDPARQLLSSIPADFPAVVLVRLHLQGGRYDRLVAQMERASALPVALAEHGARAHSGTIYFMPDGIGLRTDGDGLSFVADQAPAADLLAALPAGNSAVVFLSGSDPQLVDTAMAVSSAGMLVMAQSPEDCYDGVACADLRKRGAASGLPAELAGRLASRWPG